MKQNFVTGTSAYPESPEAVLRILNIPTTRRMGKVQAGRWNRD